MWPTEAEFSLNQYKLNSFSAICHQVQGTKRQETFGQSSL